MPTPTGRERRPRADFERNRAEILSQAERHFTELGVTASLEALEALQDDLGGELVG